MIYLSNVILDVHYDIMNSMGIQLKKHTFFYQNILTYLLMMDSLYDRSVKTLKIV